MRRLRGPLAIFVSLLAFLPAHAADLCRLDLEKLKPTAPLQFSPPKIQEARLSGGARVFLLEDHDVPLVRVFLSFRGGAVYDPPEKAGLAQVTGLAWRTGGTAARSPQALDEALEKKGIELSLSLGRDKGGASLSVLTPQVEEGLAILSQLVREPAFRQDRVDWAAAQVANGIRREGDEPESLAFRELRRALYRGHPRGVVATEETVKRVTRDDALDLHRRLLSQGAWVIGVAGDFRAEQILADLEREFGKLPGDGTAFPRLAAPPPPAPRVILVPKPLPQSTVLWARLGPNRTSPEFYALDLADYAVGSGGFQCRLSQEIRSNRGLAYSVGGFYEAYADVGVLGAYASTKKASTREVLDLVRDLMGRAAREGIGADEVARAQEALANRYVFKYQDPASLVQEQMTLALEGLPADLGTRYLPGIQAESADSVSRVARKYYGEGPGVVVVVGDVDPADAAWRSEPGLEVARTK